MTTLTLETHREEQTVALGHRLGQLSQAGDLFLLSGELGAGKTCLVRGIAAGLGVSGHAFSPSFVLVRQYPGRLPLYHMDFYRLEQPAEIADLGLDDYLFGDGVCAIEWAERACDLLPDEHLWLGLHYVPSDEEARTIQITAAGERYEQLIEKLSETARAVRIWN